MMKRTARRAEPAAPPVAYSVPPAPRPLRYLTLGEVESMTSLKRSTIERRVKEGVFPRPRDLGGRCVRWLENEVEAWMLERPVSTDGIAPRERSAA